jgi:hypothetical protein
MFCCDTFFFFDIFKILKNGMPAMKDTTNTQVFLLMKNFSALFMFFPVGFHFAAPLEQMRFLLDVKQGELMLHNQP